jgi:hypothetical protein
VQSLKDSKVQKKIEKGQSKLELDKKHARNFKISFKLLSNKEFTKQDFESYMLLPEDEELVLEFINSSRFHINIIILKIRCLIFGFFSFLGLASLAVNIFLGLSFVFALLITFMFRNRVYVYLVKGFLGSLQSNAMRLSQGNKGLKMAHLNIGLVNSSLNDLNNYEIEISIEKLSIMRNSLKIIKSLNNSI